MRRSKASPMHIRGYSSSTRSQTSNTGVLRDESDFSQASTCYSSDASATFSSSSRRSRSLRAAAQDVAGSLVTCFRPFSRKDLARDRNEDVPEPSTASATSKFNYRNYSGTESSRRDDATQFSFHDIFRATNMFSTANIIGEGHFGTIYKGRLKDGSLVAVKRAKKNAYEKHVSSEFKNEIQTLSSIEHLNLVRFLGYLEEHDERIIVVEYVSNGNLREHMNGSRGQALEIAERLQIAIDVAHAITYLHTYTDHPIIHRDIKASNILITENFRAKVADFGFARLVAEDADATHVITKVKGTAGYLDPEYLKTYELTEKSDVYSFGVLLVELVTGRRPIEPKRQKERMTTTWAMYKYNQGDVVMVMDPNLQRSQTSVILVEKLLGLAQRCLAPSRRDRPTMKMCAEVLWDIRKDSQKQKLLGSSYCTHYSQDANEKDVEKMDMNHRCKKKSHDKHEISDKSDSSMIHGLKVVREGTEWDINSPVQEAYDLAAEGLTNNHQMKHQLEGSI